MTKKQKLAWIIVMGTAWMAGAVAVGYFFVLLAVQKIEKVIFLVE